MRTDTKDYEEQGDPGRIPGIQRPDGFGHKTPEPIDIALLYVEQVLTGAIPACIYVKQACERFLDDFAKYEYRADQVRSVIIFISSLNLTEQKEPTKFVLEPWQVFIVVSIYGIYIDGERKYRSAYIELSRKNGKSQLATALSMYHLLVDPDAQVILSANSKNQVRDVDFKKVLQYAHQLDPKKKNLVPYYNSIKFGTNELIVTASDASKLDGLNVSFCLIDELHEAPNGLMYGVMKSSMGSRDQPLMIVITTAGFDTESFCYSLRTYCTDILSKMKTDESQFCIIYTIDQDDDFEDESVWQKANPNLNVSVKINYLRSEVNKAVQNSAEKSSVLVKHFNRWLRSNTSEIWIDEAYVIPSMIDLKITDSFFYGKECIVGIDLASVSDITAVSFLFNIDGVIYFFNKYYLPEISLNTNINIVSFREAGARGDLNITPGNVCDYDLILRDLESIRDHVNITLINYDIYNSTQFIINATESGFNCKPYSQTPGSLNRPLKEFERLIKSDLMRIERNALTKWMISNVVLVINKMGNISIDKAGKNKKIDGVASMVNALGGMLSNPIYNFEII